MGRYEVRPVGCIESPLTELAAAPRQGDEGAGAPGAWVIVRAEFAAAVPGLEPAAENVVLTRLQLARRDVLFRPPTRRRDQAAHRRLRHPFR